MPLDLQKALNALSDVTENRPLPLREFDQIYMKAGDMVIHTEFVARRFKDRDVVFVGDGDAIALAVVHFMQQGVINYGPRSVTLLDFDERMVLAVERFATDYGYEGVIQARLYNVIDAVPKDLVGAFSAFHINPPWGQHNDGESVVVFLERGIQMVGVGGLGMVVIADDAGLPWTNGVLGRTQEAALANGMVVGEMLPALHSYHLDDAPELRSCALTFRKVADDSIPNERLRDERLENFYGRTHPMRVRYVREIENVRQAPKGTYAIETLEE
ncbi:MAG TPA: bis-aminopropyl spermidine synthase family protein [Longimicrobium sp.]